MPLTPEQQVAEVMARMGFIRPSNLSTPLQLPAPIIAEPEPEGTEEQRLATQKSISELVRLRGFRHPNDHS